jgi:hypothetical protein
MKVKLVKFVLFLYVIFLFKPISPLISDWLSHTFNEQQHILMVHEVHGKFHIHQELAGTGQSDNEKSNELKFEVEEYLHVSPAIFKSVLYTSYHGCYLSYTLHSFISPYQDTNYPPPKSAPHNKISEAACDGSWFRA